jgi:YegS/Rv2252/BmrU family lipid kinase
MPELLIIVNPHSAGGATGRRWQEIESRLRQRLSVPFDVAFTQHACHATTLAREAAGRYGCVVAMGGDGTINEVLNGLVDDNGPLRSDLRLAIIPRGTGADFVRTLGIPRDLEGAAARVARGQVREVDLAKVHFRDFAGQDTLRFFINEGEIGLGAATCQAVNRSSKRLGPRLTYMWSTIVTVLRYRDHWVTLTLDGGQPWRIHLSNAWLANGQYSGSGIRMAPHARLDDGLLDVVAIAHMGLIEKIVRLRKLRSGEFIGQPGVTYTTARHIEARSEETVLIEVEGEPIGTLPATFELLDKRLKVVA